MADREYVLGTYDEEIERLGLQHRVWRAHMTDCWKRAGLSVGQKVLDVGAGPGYATLDLAQIVGPLGRVAALELSRSGLLQAVKKDWARMASKMWTIATSTS